MNHPAPGFEKHPGHTMVITPAGTRVGVTIDGVEIATTDAAQLLAEAGYPAVYYMPLDTLPGNMLVESDHKTYCPFKGDAGYFHLVVNEKTHENAVWTYRKPYDEALAIKNYIAICSNVADVSAKE